MDIKSQIESVSKSSHAIGALYAGMIGLALSDIIPTPADALYFWYQRKLNEDLNSGKINSKQYWIRDAAAYYSFNPIYWAGLLLVVANIKGDAAKKLKYALILASGGMVVGVLMKNIQVGNKNKITRNNIGVK